MLTGSRQSGDEQGHLVTTPTDTPTGALTGTCIDCAHPVRCTFTDGRGWAWEHASPQPSDQPGASGGHHVRPDPATVNANPAVPGRAWESIETFYAGRPDREWSGERDYGVWWRDADRDPTWRISHVEQTGEFYAICTAPWARQVVLGGVVYATPPGHGIGPVVVIGYAPTYAAGEELLDGWTDLRGSNRLSWALGMLAGSLAG